MNEILKNTFNSLLLLLGIILVLYFIVGVSINILKLFKKNKRQQNIEMLVKHLTNEEKNNK